MFYYVLFYIMMLPEKFILSLIKTVQLIILYVEFVKNYKFYPPKQWRIIIYNSLFQFFCYHFVHHFSQKQSNISLWKFPGTSFGWSRFVISYLYFDYTHVWENMDIWVGVCLGDAIWNDKYGYPSWGLFLRCFWNEK